MLMSNILITNYYDKLEGKTSRPYIALPHSKLVYIV